ncbi:uncharacterized protein CLAFUR5_05949 [Fulvia fulva]|uniref:Endonuclease/exonuclease/phosphatase domain-containing protein n=1 Tax=Passalora fulva TaxID=5499 RepID=A0A9Q8LJ86_PASFU|nr:uncharacterized protein CLAFUR5_05949 [Fulvia fulva]KAK4626027.1 hypothetical protein CLAFUR0_05813 [Fulvia fulva]UJO18402.1 hypothetical protein CLAFUR5_05949 [Fulvia fulva]
MWARSCLTALFFLSSSVLAAPSQTTVERQTGTLSQDPAGQALTFEYTTSHPFDTYWIGLYHASGGGPANEEYVAPSLVWSYAPGTPGTVTLSDDALEPGDYQAFFLAQDRYEWLAEPVNVTIEAPAADIDFPVESATLHNARQGDKYTANIAGLVLGQSQDTVIFTKVSGEDGINVSQDGLITGTPSSTSQVPAELTISATASNGSNNTIRLTIPVRLKPQRLVSDLKVMSYNLWHGGAQQLRFLLDSGAYVVAQQEASPDHAKRLGQALGWHHYQSSGSVGVISRYPIIEKYGQISASGGVRIDLNGGRDDDPVEINVWSAHLGYTPYGPYNFCFDNMTKEEVLAREAESGRIPQITAILDGIQSQLQEADRVPVILAGDFNAPSHLEWVPSLQEKNCDNDSLDWPTSILPTEHGLIDSFRVAHPDPAREQATTWSPVFPKHNGATGRDEPQDRIDFVYHTEDRLRVIGSEHLIVGDPAPSPGHKENEWTSDHAAVLTHYELL